VGRLVPL
jgi:hypothetical protein